MPALTGNPWIDIILTLAIIAIVLVTIVQLARYVGFEIPRIVFIVGGAIVGILLIVWLAKLLSGAGP